MYIKLILSIYCNFTNEKRIKKANSFNLIASTQIEFHHVILKDLNLFYLNIYN
jgi:hypothetical protein